VRPVVVLIFHAQAPRGAGPLTRALAETRHELAARQREGFLAAGADSVEIVEGPPDGHSFGERLAAELRTRKRRFGRGGHPGGVVVLGSGSIPLARPADLRFFVDVAAGSPGRAVANNRFSADVVAISRPEDLAQLPPLPADNALPRWLEEKAGVTVTDLRARWRLGVDIDTPLDVLLLDGASGTEEADPDAATATTPAPHASSPEPFLPTKLVPAGRAKVPILRTRLEQLTEIMADKRAELLVAGRVSASTLRWLEKGVACRVRALVEERGLRAATTLAQSGATTGDRPPRSVLGELLDHEGPEGLARVVERLADAAVIDTRVLLAHRLGADEANWPAPEERYASDLLLPPTISDAWLCTLTVAASTRRSVPIILGGHTLVNGGLRLLAQRARAGSR
jgi:hypothetical protein